MTDKTTDAANAWLILNDADVVEKKLIDFMGRLFKENAVNRDMFMHMLMGTGAAHSRVHQIIEGELNYRLNDTLKRTLESAEVVIQDGITTYKPQIAVRFYAPNGASFVVYPKVSRV
jgi:hypothetical protein